MVDNAASVFYGIAYVIFFAIPLLGAKTIRQHAPWWVRVTAACGLIVSLLAIVFTIFPIIGVQSVLIFAAKIIIVSIAANAVGVAIFALGGKERAAAIN